MTNTSRMSRFLCGFVLGLSGCCHPCYQPLAIYHGSVRDLPLASAAYRKFSPEECPADLKPTETVVPANFRCLNAGQAQCLAAQAATVAVLLDKERAVLAAKMHPCNHPKVSQVLGLQDQVLYYTSVVERNDAAASALDLYFRLAEAEAQLSVLGESLRETQSALVKTRALVKQGLSTQVDYEDLRRQEIDLQDKEVQLKASISQLNSGLRVLLKLADCADGTAFRPERADLLQAGAAVDLHAAIQVGMENHPELAMLRLLEQQFEPITVPVVVAVLKKVHPALGSASPEKCPPLAMLLRSLGCVNHAEMQLRAEQLHQYLVDREAMIAEEIKRAVSKLDAQTQRIVLARDRVQSLESKLRDVKDKHGSGLATFVQVTLAQLEQLASHGSLLEEMRAWHLAHIELKKAQGILPHECANGRPCTESLPSAAPIILRLPKEAANDDSVEQKP